MTEAIDDVAIRLRAWERRANRVCLMEVVRMVGRRALNNPQSRWPVVLLALLVLVVGLGAATARKKKPKMAEPPPDLPGHVAFLAWQLRGVHLDESEPITSKIEKLVLDHLQAWIAERTPTSVEVRRELEAVFSKLRYPTYAKPACFDEPWKGGVLIGAGYTLGWTNYDRTNVIALFDSRSGKTRLVALTRFLPRVDIHYEFPREPGSDVFRFFVYGFRPGKSQLRLSAMLYAFDGQELKPQWQTQDVYDGKMTVDSRMVTIRYLKEEEYVREVAHGRKPMRHQAIYRITPQGLELETEQEIPF